MSHAMNVTQSHRFSAARAFRPITLIVLINVVIAAALLLTLTIDSRPVTSSPLPPAGPQSPQSPAPLAAAAATDEPKVEVAAADKPAAAAEAAPAASSEELVPLPLELPNPVFAGTPTQIPTDIRIDRKRLGKRRPDFMAPKDVKNLAVEKPVISSDANPIIGSLDLITDGDKEALDGRMVELAPGKQWVQIDLGAEAQIFAVVFWHNHMEPRVYRDVIVQVSNDPEFKEGVTVVYNNDHDNTLGAGAGEMYEYFETDEGELAPVPGLKARYVRLWSNGSTMDDQNHYSEVEVWGRPAAQ